MFDFQGLKVLETTLTLPGLTRPLTLLHVTDLHLLDVDDTDPPLVQQLHDNNATWFDDSHRVSDAVAAYVEREAPDLVVLTGDITGYPTEACARALRTLLNRIPSYLFTFGNHERIFVKEDLPRERMERYTYLYDFALKGEDPAVQIVEMGGVRIIALDDSDNQITPDQLTKLRRLFADGMPTLLFFHVPLSLPALYDDVVKSWGVPLMLAIPSDSSVPGDEYLLPTETTEAFRRLLTEEETPVEAIFAGHLHGFDRADPFYSGKDQILTPMANGAVGVVRRIRLLPRES